MDKKSRNLELEAWLIETASEEIIVNLLGPDWNRFDDELGYYPNIGMTMACEAWQHQQAKVEELEKEWLEMNQQHEKAVKECFEVNSENRKLQKQVTDLDNRATQYALDEMATAKLNGELQKRVDMALELCKKGGALSACLAMQVEKALKGEGQ